ncbi:MAG: endopeptidase La [Firmicutes bacterium]|nr:endopeptidase La [Bacillota bacterium]
MEELHKQTIQNITSTNEAVYKMITLRGVVAFPGQMVHFDILRDKSIIALNKAMEEGKTVFLATQKNANTLSPQPKDIHRIGCLAQLKQVIRMPGDAVRVMAFATDRATINNYVTLMPHFEVTVEPYPSEPSETLLVEAIRRKISEQFEQYRKLNNRIPPDVDAALRISDATNFIGLFGTHILKKDDEKQKLLMLPDEFSQLEEIYTYLTRECEILGVEKKISQKVSQNIAKHQKDLFLREQIKVIHEELGDNADELLEFKERVEKKKMPESVKERCLKEITKLERMSQQGPEAAVSRSYIEWILDLEWDKQSKDTVDLKKVKKILDEDHYSIEKVKERIVEYLAVTKLNKEIKGPILCFVGPPGVGKTSIVESIARASGRKFVSMSLGGVRDEAEIRGHRRTYIGALPGRIISAMKNAETINPVFLLDEIDKMSSDFRGDPASAMLEVLDPNQNAKFKDHYLELPYDLSKVMFVTTANTLDTIPMPLLDRMEIIELSGYTQEEKLQIAKRYLLPKQIKANGLEEGQVNIDDKVMLKITSGYTRESGVRNLEREIGTVCRKVAVKVVNGDIKKGESFSVESKHLTDFLGVEKYKKDKSLESDEVGTATGLAWTSVGGTTLTIEVVLIPSGKGDIILTGSLGDVMRESCQAAMSLVKTRAEAFGIPSEAFKTNDVHVHFPEGATPKDGPSAGITIATAVLSAFSGKKISKSVAMTGEVTLRGKVLAIGGLKEKSLAAYRVGIKKIIIPSENKKDVKDLPSEVTDTVKIIFADNIDEVFDNAFV